MDRIHNNIMYKEQLRLYANCIFSWHELRNKTILITGATGMIGVYFIDLLMYRNHYYQDNITVIGVSRDKKRLKERLSSYMDDKNFIYVVQDVNETFSLKEDIKHVDYIIHGASNTHPVQYATDPIGTIDTNVIGTKNMLEYAVKKKVSRIAFISSVEIYGENRGDIEEFQEDYCGYVNCNTLRACYSEGKRLGESMCQAYIESRNLDIVIPRISRVYGPTMQWSDTKAISQLIKNGVNKEDIVLKSEGKQKYSYTYVGDVVMAILTILIKGAKGNAYNVANRNSNLTLAELANLVALLQNKNVIYEIPEERERQGYSVVTKALLNPDKLMKLGWTCQYGMKEGLDITCSILRSSRNGGVR